MGEITRYIMGEIYWYILARKLTMPLNLIPCQRATNKSLIGEPQTEFIFIKDKALRSRISIDWEEAKKVFETGAWKSTLILCGSILEALLIAKLKEIEEEAENVYSHINKRKPSRNLEEWRLVNLVGVASRVGLIVQSSSHLSHAVRHYRNLVHPTRHIKEDIEISKETAAVAINSVRVFIRELRQS